LTIDQIRLVAGVGQPLHRAGFVLCHADNFRGRQCFQRGNQAVAYDGAVFDDIRFESLHDMTMGLLGIVSAMGMLVPQTVQLRITIWFACCITQTAQGRARTLFT
jgi:hypothetical protein